ncbi:MAG: hypothetical protein N2484_17275 [Clostridia bacterium]|nr:hypothetical protein [Clostridia bacterium]
MAHNTNELRKQIVEKNLLLKKIRREDHSTDDKVKQVQIELDKLLYCYLKSLKSSGSNYMNSIAEG